MNDFDFYISSRGRLIVPKYNIDYLINFETSTIPSIPNANENTVKIAGRDGDISISTTYDPLSFNIVCYTEDNLSPQEKIKEERKITAFLNEMKNKYKTFAMENEKKFYKVKYSGSLIVTRYPKSISFSIPFVSHESYAKSTTNKIIKGNGTETSETIKEVGAIFTINGPATNPIISLNNYLMELGTPILEGNKIIIDSLNSTATHIAASGIKLNVMKFFNHQFPKIQYGENTLRVNSGIDNPEQVTVEWNDLMF